MYVVYSLKGPDWKRNLFLIFLTETISRPDEGQPRPKYIFDKYGTKIYFLFTLQRFGPSPSPNFKRKLEIRLFLNKTAEKNKPTCFKLAVAILCCAQCSVIFQNRERGIEFCRSKK